MRFEMEATSSRSTGRPAVAGGASGLFALAALLYGFTGDAFAQPASSGGGGYKLTEAELKLDCPKLTGQMKVRILNMRADMEAQRGTTASRTVQSAVVPIFGGTSRGADPAADIRRDRAKLDAFNRRLAEKNCKTLDIDAELRGEAPARKDAKPAATSR